MPEVHRFRDQKELLTWMDKSFKIFKEEDVPEEDMYVTVYVRPYSNNQAFFVHISPPMYYNLYVPGGNWKVVKRYDDPEELKDKITRSERKCEAWYRDQPKERFTQLNWTEPREKERKKESCECSKV